MDVDVGEGNVSEMASSTNVPPLDLGALAVGKQIEREEERKTSFENRDGQVVAVHPLSSPEIRQWSFRCWEFHFHQVEGWEM